MSGESVDPPPVDWAEVRLRLDAAARSVVDAGQAQDDDASARARAVLEERARALAVRPAGEEARGDEVELVTFTLAGETYAVESRYAVQVARAEGVTPVPGAPPPLVAVTAWRGDLLSIYDLRALLGLPSGGVGDAAWLVILGLGGPAFAVPADEPGEFRAVPAADVRPPAGTEAGRYVRGLTPDAVVVLDAAALLREHG